MQLWIPIEPHPASRPRTSKYGVHYSKGHTAYKHACLEFLKSLDDLPPPNVTDPLTVTLIFRCTKARTSRLIVPRYDIDNLAKLPLDCMTSSGLFWKDDVQVAELIAIKRFTETNEEPGTLVSVELYEPTNRNT